MILVETPEHPGLLLPASAVSDDHGSPGSAGDVTESKTAEEGDLESVQEPAKVMRIASMVRQLLEEVHNATLDDAGRIRMREIYDQSRRELASALSPDLAEELNRMALPFESEAPSDAELRVAQAQLVGWLEGLFHGIQAAVFAQQIAAQAQLDQMRRSGLPTPGQTTESPNPAVPGAYL